MSAKTTTALATLTVAILAIGFMLLRDETPPAQEDSPKNAHPDTPIDLMDQLKAIETDVDSDPGLGFANQLEAPENNQLLRAKKRYKDLTFLSDAQRSAAVVNWAEDIAENNPKQAMDAFWAIVDSGFSKSRSDAFSFVESLSSSIALFNPEATQDWIDALPDPFDEHALQYAVKTWASIDPIGTIEYIKSIPDPVLRAVAINSLHRNQYSNTDPEFSNVFIEAFYETADKRISQAISHHLVRVSEAEARDWVESMDDPIQRDSNWNTLVKSLAQIDVPTAQRLALTAPSEQLRIASIIDVASTWGREQPSLALDWAIGFQNDQAIMGATSNVFPIWVQNDRTGAIDWLNRAQLPSDSRKLLEGFRDGSPSPD